MPSEVDFHSQQLSCHIRIHPKLSLVTDPPTTRDNLLAQVKTHLFNQSNLRQETQELLLQRPLEESTYKICEQGLSITNNSQFK